MKYKLIGLVLVLIASGFAFEIAAQKEGGIKTAILQTRHRDDVAGIDNYEYSTFSFLIGQNGSEAQKRIRNDWDLQFSKRIRGGVQRDYFSVTMVVSDRSRIVDLGALEWADPIALPDLPAYETPTREKDVEAKLGHMYYVHTADSDSDHYALFRVEEISSGVSVSISWKLLTTPAVSSK